MTGLQLPLTSRLSGYDHGHWRFFVMTKVNDYHQRKHGSGAALTFLTSTNSHCTRALEPSSADHILREGEPMNVQMLFVCLFVSWGKANEFKKKFKRKIRS